MKKAVVLVTVIIVTLMLAIMAAIVIYVMTQQAYVAENKIKRSRGEYAAMAALAEVHSQLRNNLANITSNTTIVVGSANDGAPYPLKVNVNITNATEYPVNSGIKKIKLTVVY